MEILLSDLFKKLSDEPNSPEYQANIKLLQTEFRRTNDTEVKNRIREFDAEILIPRHRFTQLPPESMPIPHVHASPRVSMIDPEPRSKVEILEQRKSINWAAISALSGLAVLILMIIIYILEN